MLLVNENPDLQAYRITKFLPFATVSYARKRELESQGKWT